MFLGSCGDQDINLIEATKPLLIRQIIEAIKPLIRRQMFHSSKGRYVYIWSLGNFAYHFFIIIC